MSSPVGRELMQRYGINEVAFRSANEAARSNDKVGWLILAARFATALVYLFASR